jgi:ATP-dependent Clp protease ATP-binding subunit ClpA
MLLFLASPLTGDLAKAAELQHSSIPRLEAELDAWDKKEHAPPTKGGKEHKMLSDFVSADAIATVVARHTGIPVSRITGSESLKLLKLEDQLRQRVVGQDAALSAVSDCVRLARTRLQASDRTLGNFLFIGPTGKLSLFFLNVQCFTTNFNTDIRKISPFQALVKPSFARHWQSLCSIMKMR